MDQGISPEEQVQAHKRFGGRVGLRGAREGTGQHLHLDTVVGMYPDTGFIKTQDGPRRVAQLVMIEF